MTLRKHSELTKLAIILVALAVIIATSGQLSLAASIVATATQPTTTQQPNPNDKPPKSKFDNCNANTSIRIEQKNLKTDVGRTLMRKEVFALLHCPTNEAVAIKPRWSANRRAAALADAVRANLTVCAWSRKGKPLHRLNGNPILKDYEDDPNSIALLQPTESDEGSYTCSIDYSGVMPEYYEAAKNYLTLHQSLTFEAELDALDTTNPDTPPQIKYPPVPTKARPGDNLTFTCQHMETHLSQVVYWFRSRCNISEVQTYAACKDKFLDAYGATRQAQDVGHMRSYIIDGEDGDTFTIKNISSDSVDTYGCLVLNAHGLDIRIADLSLEIIRGTYHDASSSSPPQMSSVHQNTNLDRDWTAAMYVTIFFLLVILLMFLSCQCRKHLKKPISLLKQMVVEEGPKENSSRQHLPKVISPDIYNTGKPDECHIYGHTHQKGGHLLAQSVCKANLTLEKNLSISSNNYHSDESSSWGKSLSSSGDNSRSFYQHTSNNTATTVQLYDRLPLSGTTQPNGALVRGSCVNNPTYGLLVSDFDAKHPEWTFSRRNLEPEEMIGKGQFGEVWRYVAHQKDGTRSCVAVKKLTVRSGQEQQAKDEILKEIDIMKRVNDHPNVIKFLNRCIEPTNVLIIMEYADNGTLQAYLRRSRHAKDQDDCSVTSKDLLKYSYHVAKGMEYIASKGIVHRDLATRNVLLSKDKICKIADFGLARFVGDVGIYQRLDRNQPVPIKWMAPESLSECGTYTSKSDVFSAGILMWEIVTLGATPYDFLKTSEVLKKVVNGERLSRPQHCKEEFYNIMDRCWHQDPIERPTFKRLADDLEVLLQSENDYIQLDKYPEHAYYNINTINAEKELVTSLPLYPELDNVFDQ